jgi:hypothetical protein
MSMESCMVALTTPTLSSASAHKLHVLNTAGKIDWGVMWSLVLQYGPLVVKALEEILPLIGVTTPWTDILNMILAELTKLTGQSVVV